MSSPEASWEAKRVRARLQRLARRSAAARVFGFSGHGFKLNPTLSETEVPAIEDFWKFRLPADYRTFITEATDGGPGPGYGLFPFGRHGETAYESETWHMGIGDPSRDFPHHAPWNLSPAELTPPPEASDVELHQWFADFDARYFDTALINGTIPIGHMGCAIWVRLVVTGIHAGEVWLDDRSSDQGIYPDEPASFSDWYLQWLAEAETASRRFRR
jgi:hypothetical protein